MADRPTPEQPSPGNTKSGIHSLACYNIPHVSPSASDLKAPTKHYPSTTAMVPKKANVIDGPGKGKGIKGEGH